MQQISSWSSSSCAFLVDIEPPCHALHIAKHLHYSDWLAAAVHLILCMSRTSLQLSVANQRPAVTNAPSSMLQAELDDVEWLMQHLQTLSSSSSSRSAAGPTTADLEHLQEQQEELELGLWKAVKALKTWSNKPVETAADLLQEV
jgi:hypothetical protein